MIILFVMMSVLRLPSTSQPAVAVTVESAEDDTVDICYNVGPEHPVAGPSSASQRTVALAVDVVDDFVVCGDLELAPEPLVYHITNNLPVL